MARELYSGTSRKLVLAFDIGTEYSGAAYAFLDPGEVPEIGSVTKYFDNPNIGSAKVPSIVYYDRDGNFRGVENGTGLDEDKSLLQLRWWKFMLGPAEPVAVLKGQIGKELPKGKTIVDVFSDFMRYLFHSTKTFFVAVSSGRKGELRWNSVSSNIELVLTHPNGWGGPQQSQLRAAAVQAQLVPNTPAGHERVHFMTEGEASLHFCATHTQLCENLKDGDKVLLIDAGKSTINISPYMVIKSAPLQVKELCQPKCLLQGGDFVTAKAREMASERLGKSKFNTLEDISAFTQKFDEGLKRVFFDDTEKQYVRFSSFGDNDPEHGIKGGRLMLTGEQVAKFFEPSIQSTVDTVRDSFMEILPKNSFAFLIGEFTSSPWLTSQLNIRLSDLGLKLLKPKTNIDKSVAIGAVSFLVEVFIKGYLSKFTYGVPHPVLYNPFDQTHIKREHKTYVDELGDTYVTGAFKTMLFKGIKVFESGEIRTRMHAVHEGTPVSEISVEIIKYEGCRKEPRWMDVEPNGFETLCHVVADISTAPFTCKVGKSGKTCYEREYDIVLLVSVMGVKAQVRWFDCTTGIEKR